MRIAFVNTFIEQAKKNKDIMLLTADLGFSVFEKLMKEHPKQYLNVGIAEQHMAGMAAGMAMEGKMPFIYSIVPFAVMRNFEQIRNDICYQNQNVKIVGVGAGFSYGPYGHTHHGLEDIGILRTLPNMTILAPGDPVEVKLATEAMIQHVGPVYLRLGKAGEPILHKKAPKFEIGKGILIKDGKDITIISNSTLLYRAHEVVETLTTKGLSIRFVSMPTVKPLDTQIIKESAKKTKGIFVIEEHSLIGGLGSAVAEFCAESSLNILFKRIAVPDRFTKVMGLQEFMRDANELTLEKIDKTITLMLHEHKSR